MSDKDDHGTDRACVLFSGGLESAYLLHQVSRDRDVLPAYVRFGFAWEDTEYGYACDFADEIGAPEPHELRAPVEDVYPDFWGFTRDGVPDGSEEGGHYIHGRNVLLFSKAAVLCTREGVNEIYHGMQPVLSGFPDESYEFRRSMETSLSLGLDSEISITTPLEADTKEEVVGAATEAGVPLKNTFSCIDPTDGEHCGECKKCKDRHASFVNAGVEDPTGYAVEPPSP
jgi:7-cyano-7-deazaguanine synthase